MKRLFYIIAFLITLIIVISLIGAFLAFLGLQQFETSFDESIDVVEEVVEDVEEDVELKPAEAEDGEEEVVQ